MRIFVLILSIGILSSYCIASSQSEDIFLMREVVSIDLGCIERRPGNWGLLMIKPSPLSSLALVGEIKIGSDGKQKDSSLGSPIQNVSGVFEVQEIFSGEFDKKQAGYSWKKDASPKESFRGLPREDWTSIFYSKMGGLVLCSYDGSKSGRGRFVEGYLVPDDWAVYLIAALHERKANAESISKAAAIGSESEEMRQFLLRQATGKNPFLAISAFKILCTDRSLDDTLVRDCIFTTTGIRQAGFVSIFLSSLEHRPGRVDMLTRSIKFTDQPYKLYGIAIAAWDMRFDRDPALSWKKLITSLPIERFRDSDHGDLYFERIVRMKIFVSDSLVPPDDE
ncbi:MAG: hypothetical protein HS116_20975 [Planctomycetes bacterium]|nr:hypothetical protein [Planctomycetota bacterium]